MEKKIITAYYSFSGDTRKVAEKINSQTKGTVHEIVPAQEYTHDYRDLEQQAKHEVESGYEPELKPNSFDETDFDILFIGSPNWWHSIVPPVRSFLTNLDMSGKIVVPFITHGGGGLERCGQAIKSLCPQADVKEPLAVYGSGSGSIEQEIADWLKRLDLS